MPGTKKEDKIESNVEKDMLRKLVAAFRTILSDSLYNIALDCPHLNMKLKAASINDTSSVPIRSPLFL